MPLSQEEKISFLQQHPLFGYLTKEDQTAIAQRLQVWHFNTGGTIFMQGEQSEKMYMVYSGKITLTRIENNKRVPLATFLPGHSFCIRSLLFNQQLSETATATEKSVLFSLSVDDFEWLLMSYPEMKGLLFTLARSNRIIYSQRFDWLQTDESIHFATQRNLFGLSRELGTPLLFLIITIALLFTGSLGIAIPAPLFSLAGVCAVLFFGGLFWKIFDWRQDFFIITNLRVIQLEGMLFFGSRQKETPLNQIQFIHTRSDTFGNLFHYGDILIRTFTSIGNTILSYVNYPTFFKDVLYEQCLIAEQNSHDIRDQNYRQSIQQALGYGKKEIVSQPGPSQISLPEEVRSKWIIFRKRVNTGNNITYYKHWVVLLKKILLPILLLSSMLIFNIAAYNNQVDVVMDFHFPSLCSAQLLLAVFCILIIWYQYSDYKNDLYQLTDDLIIDREKKPLFGRMEIKTAPLKNVQSTWIDRSGLLRHFLNYGTVHINIADHTLDFMHVYDPGLVQQDIFSKLNQLHQYESEKNAAAEMNRMTDMIRAYHEVNQDMNDQDTPFSTGKAE